MTIDQLLLATLLSPFITAILSPLAFRYFKNRNVAVWVPLLGAGIPFASLLSIYTSIKKTGLPAFVEFTWIDSLALRFTFICDGFGVLFALLVSGMGLLILIYAHYYMGEEKGVGRFFGFLLFFLGAMLGVCLSEHIFSLFTFWELTSISSFLLIGYWHEKEKSRAGALKALVITSGGGLVMMAGLALLGAKTNLWTWTQISAVAPSIISEPWMGAALICIAIGAFAKSAQAPFHIWLPDAMEAPTPVSAYLHSATMVKAGIILLFRIYPIFSEHALWFPLLTTVGMITVVVGAVLALKHTDLKAILAYSTISQLGLFVVMHGYASIETIIRSGLIFHIFVHAFYKGSLFMFAGVIDHATHTRDIRNLGLLKKVLPRTAIFMTLAACSLAGLPPFLGFISKEGAIENTLHIAHSVHGGAWILPFALGLSAAINIAVAGKISLGVFFAPAQNEYYLKENHPHKPPLGFILPPIILAACGLIFGLAPGLLEYILYPVAMVGLFGFETPHFKLWHGFTSALFVSLTAIGSGLVIYKFRQPIQKIHERLKLGWNLNTVYEKKWEFILNLAGRTTRFLQNGSLSIYAGVTVGFMSFLVLLTTFTKINWEPLSLRNPINFSFEAFISLGICMSALMVTFLKDRLARLVSLGGTGVLICSFFIVRGAPDLALTGFLVEIVLFVLILIVFKQMDPAEEVNQKSKQNKLFAMVAGAGGVSIGLLVYVALSFPLSEKISSYFTQHAQSLAGGSNIVNVIVVDFRGFDTMGEIAVLCLAGLGVFALRQVWLQNPPIEAEPKENAQTVLPPSQILEAINQVIVPIAILFSFYMVLRGHNNPGGGFIGGLITAGAFILELMVTGKNRFKKYFPIQGRTLFSLGLLIAFLTGLTPLFYGYPFLTSYIFHTVHFSTAAIFDLGVYFVVVGVTVEIINLIESRKEEATA